MNNGSKVQAIRETVLFTLISTAIILACLYIQFLYVAGYFLWPIPLALIYIRHNFGFSVLSIVITTVIVSSIAGPLSALAIIPAYCGVGIVLGYSFRKKEKLSFTLLITFAISFIAWILVIQSYNTIIGYNLISASIDMLVNKMNSMKDVYISYGIPKEQVDALFKAAFDAGTLKAIVPSFIVIHSIIISFSSYWAFEKIMKKLAYKVEELKPFSQLYIPTGLSMAFMVFALLGYMFISRSPGVQDQYFANIYLIFSFIFSVSGLATISYFLRKKGFPKFIVFILSVVLVITPVVQILIYVGLADYVFNFRKLDDRKNIRNRKY